MLTKFYEYEIEGLAGYGSLHFGFVAFMILIIIASYLMVRKIGNKYSKWIIFGFGIAFLILEIYKQLWFNVLDEGQDPYVWYQFPFQLCSTPMYLCLVSVLLKEKHQKYIYSYLGFYSLLAGLSVIIYPGNIMIDNVSISSNSLMWHSMMVILGFYVIFIQDFGKSLKELLPGLYVFLILVAIAMTMNFTFKIFDNIYHIDKTFNMFYISPYYECVLPILVTIQEKTNWIIVLICYIIAITLGISLLWTIIWSVKKLIKLVTKKLKSD